MRHQTRQTLRQSTRRTVSTGNQSGQTAGRSDIAPSVTYQELSLAQLAGGGARTPTGHGYASFILLQPPAREQGHVLVAPPLQPISNERVYGKTKMNVRR